MIVPLALEIWAVETCLDVTSWRNLVYEIDLALLVLMVPTASRMATIPMASTPQSQRQLWPVDCPGCGLPSPPLGAFGPLGGFSVRCGLTPAMLGAPLAQR